MEKFEVLDELNIRGLKEFLENDDMVFDIDILKDYITTDGVYGFIYLLDNKPIGFAYSCRLARPDGKMEMYLHSINILPEYQNKGCGARFFHNILRYANTKGFCNLFLCSSQSLHNACHVYEKLGGKRECEDEIIFNYPF